VNYYYHPDARQEASAAVAYYSRISQELGATFLAELEKSVERILRMPLAWAKHIGDTRRCLLHRFPYGIVYQIESEEIQIVAVMHLHQKPGYWTARMR
jgi:plasmid stabilization system protein ParE